MESLLVLLGTVVSAMSMIVIAIINVKGHRDRISDKKLSDERHQIMLQLLKGQKVMGDMSYKNGLAIKKLSKGIPINGDIDKELEAYEAFKKERDIEIARAQAGSFNQTQTVNIGGEPMKPGKIILVCVAICAAFLVIMLVASALYSDYMSRKNYNELLDMARQEIQQMEGV
jgi:hypothetical protein